MLSAPPAITVPSGRARSGAPIGLQLIGRPFDDRGVIRAARAFERARGPWYANAANSPDLP
jgi:Asp-tRNA(Asn)/Glu-tRNA(Gln) amidotransferase A subunit family amidase